MAAARSAADWLSASFVKTASAGPCRGMEAPPDDGDHEPPDGVSSFPFFSTPENLALAGHHTRLPRS